MYETTFPGRLEFGLRVRSIYGVELYGEESFVGSIVFHNGELRSSRRVRCSIPLRAYLGRLVLDVIVAPCARWKLGL
jgi:hypothetical protein